MSSKFVNLNEIFLPTTGGDIEGSLDVNGALTVNDGSGEGTSYNVAEKISELESAWDSVSQNNKVLWNGADWMPTNRTITLSESVSTQPNGIVLIWSRYTPSTSSIGNWEFSSFFVPKQFVALHPNCSFLMEHRGSYPMFKYVSFTDTTISGASSENTIQTTVNNETFYNDYNVLRYVIGV